MDRRTHDHIWKFKTKPRKRVFATLQFLLTKYDTHRRKYSTKGLGATLCQEQPDGNFKPIRFPSRFFSETEEK